MGTGDANNFPFLILRVGVGSSWQEPEVPAEGPRAAGRPSWRGEWVLETRCVSSQDRTGAGRKGRSGRQGSTGGWNAGKSQLAGQMEGEP